MDPRKNAELDKLAAVIDAATKKTGDGSGKRKTLAENPFLGFETRPDVKNIFTLEGGYVAWAFPLTRHFSRAAGIRKNVRSWFRKDEKGDKIPVLDKFGKQMKTAAGLDAWKKDYDIKLVQSSLFNFREGDTLYDAAGAGDATWGDFIKRGGRTAKILKALPVTKKRGEERFAGRVDFVLLQARDGKLSEEGRYITTQDSFVRFLITGDAAGIETVADFARETKQAEVEEYSAEDMEAIRDIFTSKSMHPADACASPQGKPGAVAQEVPFKPMQGSLL